MAEFENCASGKPAGRTSQAKPAEAICGERTSPVTEYAAPRTPVEELVADIWAEALHVPRVGIRDDFFDLGGHSLIAMRIVAQVCRTIQADVSLHHIFEAPTVEEFSAVVVERELAPGQAGRIAGFIKSLHEASPNPQRPWRG